MSFCCNLVCIIDNQTFETLAQRIFTPNLRLPIPQDEDIIQDFKRLYRNKGTEHMTNVLGPIIQSENYEFVTYVYIVRSQVIYLAIVIPFLEKYISDSSLSLEEKKKDDDRSAKKEDQDTQELEYYVKKVDIMSCLTYLTSFHQLLSNYFHDVVMTPLMIQNNHNLIEELIDESIDSGIPQITNYNMIQEYINIEPLLENIVDQHFEDEDQEASDDDDNTESKQSKKKSTNFLSFSSFSSKSKSKSKTKTKTKPQTTTHTTSEEKGQDETYMNSFLVQSTTDAINWRPKGIHYSRNEFFLDVIEKLEYFQDLTTGEIKENYLSGSIYCKSYLSGMPLLKVGISDNKLKLNNETILSKNFKFHHCVQLKELNETREIKFIPPDGEFELASYEFKRRRTLTTTSTSTSTTSTTTTSTNTTKKTITASGGETDSPAQADVPEPVTIHHSEVDTPVIKICEYKIVEKPSKYLRIFVNFKTFFKKQSSTTTLKIKIPVIDLFQKYQINLQKNPKFKTDWGKLYFNISDDYILWDVGHIKGGYGDKIYESVIQFELVNEEEELKQQEILKNSMDPPPLRKGPKLDEIYKQLHSDIHPSLSTPASTTISGQVENRITHPHREHPKSSNNPLNSKLIKIEFEIPYYTCSGLKIDFLKINEDNIKDYQTFPWIRYNTINADAYSFQIS